MKNNSKKIILLFIFLLIVEKIIAQPPPPPVGLPIDGGIGFLFIAGVLYGMCKLKK